jgi:thiol-disulfide isomerase/thioredoxin
MARQKVLGTSLLFGMLLAAGRAEEAVKPIAPGEKVPNKTSLRDLRGNRRSLHDFKGRAAVVLAFLGADCPVSNLYLPGLIELEKKYRPKKVQFLAVYPNEGEDLDKVAGHALDRDVPFLVVKDCGQQLADRLGVSRVPAVVVLDGDLVLRYRGRIDDRYGAASRRTKATREDLVQAIEEVLAGKKVTVAETEADGCLLGRAAKGGPRPDVTFARHVAPILQKRCQACHRPGQSAPFALVTYDDAVKHAAMLKEVTTQRRMPPWHADPRYGHFSNDRRMTREEIDTLSAWVDGGMARGNERDLPAPPAWPGDWVHGKPDLVLQMPEEFEVPADGVLPYKNWILDPHFTEDRWVKIAEARPGAPEVVHHIVAYIEKDGKRGRLNSERGLSILVGWAPGDLGLVCPPNAAMRIPRGAQLRLEMHYTPNGTKMKDRSSVGITFAKEPPKYEVFLHEFANTAFEIPPHDPHYKAEATFRLRADARILSFAPHMHWRGKDYRYEAIYPDGKRETLLSVPRWDFNWQNGYRFAEPLKVPRGTKLHAVAHWDNSANNPLNPDPARKVRFGLQTWDEMMVGFVLYVWERPETAEELAKDPLSPADLFFDRLDVNGDDFITPDEVPERLRLPLLAAGVKVPEKMGREEFRKFYEEMRKRFTSRRPDPKDGDGTRKPSDKPEPKKMP